jgi:uncharacterized protein (DUF433 family)
MPALRTIAARLRNRKFTPAEICAMFGLTPAHVNNLIDEIVTVGVAQTGNRKRLVEYQGLSILLLAEQLVYYQLKPELRREALKQAARTRAKRVVVPGTNLSVLFEPYRERAQDAMRRLYEAEGAVQSRPDVMQGEPCVRGTRIPVYVVAAIARAKGRNEAIATYPSLSLAQVELAELFAQAHPRRGRPKTTPGLSEGKVVMTKVIRRNKAR